MLNCFKFTAFTKGLILAQKIISTNKQTNNYKANFHLARINVKIFQIVARRRGQGPPTRAGRQPHRMTKPSLLNFNFTVFTK